MPSGSLARYLTCFFALAALSVLLSPTRVAASPAQLNLNISNNACACTDLIGSPDGEFIVGNSSVSVSVTFSFGPLRFFACDARANCQYEFGSGGSIKLVVNSAARATVIYTGEFVSAGESVVPRGDDPFNPAFSDISVDGTFTLNGFSGVGNISAFDSGVNARHLDKASVAFSGTPMPEPSSLLLLAIGLLALAARSAHRRKRILD